MHDAHADNLAPAAPGASSATEGKEECAPPEPQLLAGTPYRVIAKIGAGGMGTVVEAEHEALGKRVVVKLLLPQFARDARVVDRLKREARVLARLASPYLVAVSDLGQTADGSTYLVMERLHGRTLRQELKLRGALPVAEALKWTRQILLGLGAAHRAGIVHRDVKLDNIFVCDATEHEPRRIKLLDFGIAKVLNSAAAGLDSAGHQPTAEGTLMGSPRWLAPEQAMGKPVDARTDIYAVGLVLYSLVVGRGAFAHLRDPMDAITATILEQPQPPSQCAPQYIAPALESAIMMALEKAPERRFQSAEAFAAALESVVAAEPPSRTQPLPANLTVHRLTADNDQGRSAGDEHCPSTAPTLVRTQPLPAEAPGARAPAPAVPPNVGSEPTITSGQHVAPHSEPRARSLALFLALTAATAALLIALGVTLLRVLGVW